MNGPCSIFIYSESEDTSVYYAMNPTDGLDFLKQLAEVLSFWIKVKSEKINYPIRSLPVKITVYDRSSHFPLLSFQTTIDLIREENKQ